MNIEELAWSHLQTDAQSQTLFYPLDRHISSWACVGDIYCGLIESCPTGGLWTQSEDPAVHLSLLQTEIFGYFETSLIGLE